MSNPSSAMPRAGTSQPPRQGPALADQLAQVARCVRGVAQGQSLTELLGAVPAGLRPGVQALSFEVLRRWGRARALVRRLAPKRPEPLTEALLGSAVALMADELAGLPGGRSSGYDRHTLVNQSVEAAKRAPATRRHASFINACLRRLLREADALQEGLDQDLEASWNHPLWWIERLRQEHPAQWQAILSANNAPGPMTLRVNRRLMTRQDYLVHLAAAGLPAEAVGEDGVVLRQPQPVQRLPGFDQGWCSVQDAAAQWAAPLLLQDLPSRRPDGQRWRVLDACAAPGGKTAHLLERADLDMTALDVDADRCERVRDNLARLGLSAHVQTADAADTATWWDGQLFDAILLDAPCTASGIVRRHPDVRWLRRATDIAQLANTQKTLLEALWPLLAPGGRMLYATCSVFRAEGEDQVLAFLSRHTDARREPSPGHILPGNAGTGACITDNVPGGYDGFFYARLDKAAP